MNAQEQLDVTWVTALEGMDFESRLKFTTEFDDIAKQWMVRVRPEKLAEVWGTTVDAIQGRDALADLMKQMNEDRT